MRDDGGGSGLTPASRVQLTAVHRGITRDSERGKNRLFPTARLFLVEWGPIGGTSSRPGLVSAICRGFIGWLPSVKLNVMISNQRVLPRHSRQSFDD